MAKKKDEKEGLVITPRLKRNWLMIRKAYNVSLEAFGANISRLSEDEANEMYELIRHALYKDNIAQIIQEEPKMREFLRNEDDRLCMYEIYENLSWKLGKREKAPEYKQKINRFRMAVKKTLVP